MATAIEKLRFLHIHNGHNASTVARDHGGVGVYISYRPKKDGRAYQNAAWQVVRPGFKTDSDGFWRDHGHKTFNVFAPVEKEPQRVAAEKWASNRYGVSEWVKIPGLPGCLFPAQDAAIIKDLVKKVQI